MMNNSLKGALLSGAVFPGLGQVFLKHYKPGIVMMSAIFTSLMVIAFKTVQDVLIILEKIGLEVGMIDIKTITAASTQASSSDSIIYNLGLLFIIICCIFGIVDAYRIGKKTDLGDIKTVSQV